MAIQFDNTNTGVATLKPASSGTLTLTLPTADGTNGQALTTNGSGQLSFATPSGGITGFTAAESTAAPNATVYVDSLTSSAASTNADVAFVAKGTGATLAQVPDSTTAGGNKRGIFATDWQKGRNAAAQVSSGIYSVISGGLKNTSSGITSTVGGGQTNTASGTSSSVGGGDSNTANQSWATIAGGIFNTVSGGSATVVGGNSNTASSPCSFVGGGFTNETKTSTTGCNTVVGGANNIASGDYSFVGGGGDAVTATNRNTASGANSVVVGGLANTASGANSFVSSGSNNTAPGGNSAVVGGDSNTTSGTYSSVAGGVGNLAGSNSSAILGGQSNNTSANNSVILGGTNNLTDAVSSSVLGGSRGRTRGIVGYAVIPASNSPISTTAGGVQLALLVLGRQTTDATATVLASNTSAASTTNQVILPNNSAYYFRGECIAGVTGAGDSSAWTFEGLIKRGANAASTVIVQSTVNLVGQDTGASAWVAAISADTTNGGLAVTVTGQASTTIRWVCKVETTEMTY